MGWTPDTQTASVFATIIINLIVGSIFLIGFELLRSNGDIFAPRKNWIGPDDRTLMPNRGFLAWIPQVLSVDDEVVLDTLGLDAYMLLRFLKMCFTIGAYTSFLALVVLLPIYCTAPYNKNAVGINRYSMGHIQEQGVRLWAPMVFTYVFAFIFLYFIYKEYEHYVEKRKVYFRTVAGTASAEKQPLQTKYSIRVENIPQEYRTNEALKRFFDAVFPNEVYSAHIMVDAPALDEAIAKRNEARAKLENAIASLHASKDGLTRPTVSLRKGQSLVVCAV
jgi:hypothetical protein